MGSPGWLDGLLPPATPLTLSSLPKATPLWIILWRYCALAEHGIAASCAATSATVEPINTRAGSRSVSQWRSIGMEGAWYLPPQLGRKKILPVSKEPL